VRPVRRRWRERQRARRRRPRYTRRATEQPAAIPPPTTCLRSSAACDVGASSPPGLLWPRLLSHARHTPALLRRGAPGASAPQLLWRRRRPRTTPAGTLTVVRRLFSACSSCCLQLSCPFLPPRCAKRLHRLRCFIGAAALRATSRKKACHEPAADEEDAWRASSVRNAVTNCAPAHTLLPPHRRPPLDAEPQEEEVKKAVGEESSAFS